MLVSVIIPCYNVEAFIGECVDSVLNQTYQEIEIICVDNNSSDNTWQTLIQLKNKFPHLIIDKEIKAGACAARNKGLNIANGDWVQFLDADDLLLPKKIEHQVELLKCTSNIAFVAGAFIRRNLKGIDVEIITLNSEKFIAPFVNQAGITSSNFWNKKALCQIGSWNENLKSSQEADLMLRLVLNEGEFLIDKKPLTIIRERESGQISQRNPSEKWMQYIDVRLKFIKELKKKFPEVYRENKNSYIDFLLVSLITLAQYNKQVANNIYIKNIRAEHSFNISKLRSSFIKLLGFGLFLSLKSIVKRASDKQPVIVE